MQNTRQFSLIKVQGPDAKKFLQGQLTCDVERVQLTPQLAAHCNPQGRVVSLFLYFSSRTKLLFITAKEYV